MKCNPLRWLWGLLPILGLTWLAVQVNYASIEADLTRRVDASLRDAGLRWARSKFEGRDGVVLGRASDEDEPIRAMQGARNTWGVRIAENRAELIERVENYKWSATRQGNRVVLRGMAPNDEVRQSIVATARRAIVNTTVEDQMEIRRGVPALDTWQPAVAFALKQLAGLKSGEARLDTLVLSVSGEAETVPSYRTVKSALANELPRAVRLADDRVTAPVVKPYIWTAKHGNGELTLTGYVPSERVRGEVTSAARAAFPRARFTDRLEIGDGSPPGFVTAIAASLRDLQRLEDGVADIRDAQLTFSGMAADEQIATDVRRALRAAMPQSIRFVDQIRFREAQPPMPPAPMPMPTPTLPTVTAQSPYTTSAEVDGSRVVLNGYAPSNEAVMTAEQSARTRFPGRAINNRLEVASGAPDGWLRCLDGGLFGLARAGTGRLAMSDRRLEVNGVADDEDLVDAIPGDVRGQLQGACDSNVRITAAPEPDLNWRAIRTGNELVLSGDVPSAAVRVSLLQTASRSFGSTVRVVDNMQVVENRSRRWPRVADQGLRMLATLKSGEAILSRQQLAITGEAQDNAIVGGIRTQLDRDLPRGYSGRERIAVAAASPSPPPPRRDTPVNQCQESLRAVARDGIIQFERAKADLARESNATLGRLAQVALDCPSAKIEIEGHTDAEGTPERNQRLSDRRAQAVVDYLVRAGVDPNKLVAVGYGETRPVAPNDSPENRARNRRIEFTVRE